MEIDQPYQNHNGGAIEFGPDGYLYVGLGDGGDRNDPNANGQDLSTPARFDSYASMSIIPRQARTTAFPPTIRSSTSTVRDRKSTPTASAIHGESPSTGKPECSGPAMSARSSGRKSYRHQKGANYGWSNREGTHAFGNRPPVDGVSDPVEPVWEYDHQIGKSITGGRVYRSSRVPDLSGKYLFADYVTGKDLGAELRSSHRQGDTKRAGHSRQHFGPRVR